MKLPNVLAMEEQPERLDDLIQEAPIVRLVDLILNQAIKDGALAIHIDQHQAALRVRYRLNGRLEPVMSPPVHVGPALMGRFKYLAGLDLQECRMPQQGQWLRSETQPEVMVRVDSLPCASGEQICVRLEMVQPLPTLDELDLSLANLDNLKSILRKRRGLLLVCSGQGQGKSTTMFSCLNFLASANLSTGTVEDQVCRRLDGCSQVQLNPRLGLNAGRAIRSLVEADTDVIMVDFLRGVGALEMAVEAASRGRLVLAGTYHDNAVDGADSLLRVGVDPGLVANVLVGVLSQRLARRSCPDCQAGGCANCRQTGYAGKLGVQELMRNSRSLAQLLAERASPQQLRQQASLEGMLDLRQDAQAKVHSGQLSAAESARLFLHD